MLKKYLSQVAAQEASALLRELETVVVRWANALLLCNNAEETRDDEQRCVVRIERLERDCADGTVYTALVDALVSLQVVKAVKADELALGTTTLEECVEQPTGGSRAAQELLRLGAGSARSAEFARYASRLCAVSSCGDAQGGVVVEALDTNSVVGASSSWAGAQQQVCRLRHAFSLALALLAARDDASSNLDEASHSDDDCPWSPSARLGEDRQRLLLRERDPCAATLASLLRGVDLAEAQHDKCDKVLQTIAAVYEHLAEQTQHQTLEQTPPRRVSLATAPSRAKRVRHNSLSYKAFLRDYGLCATARH